MQEAMLFERVIDSKSNGGKNLLVLRPIFSIQQPILFDEKICDKLPILLTSFSIDIQRVSRSLFLFTTIKLAICACG